MLGLTPTGTQLGYADFTGYALANGSAKTCTSTASEGNPANACEDIYDPNTETLGCLGTAASPCTRTPFMGHGRTACRPIDVIPGSRLSQAAQYINKYWVPYETLANQNSYTNNLNYGTPTGLANWYSTGRIDYNQSCEEPGCADRRVRAPGQHRARTRSAALGRRSTRRSPIIRSPTSTS